MYLENYKAIYINIPGINVSRVLQCFGGSSYATHFNNLSPHSIINIWGHDVWKDSYKFTFIQNPWARMLNIYLAKKQKFGKFPTFNPWLQKNLKKHAILPQVAYFTDTNFVPFVDYIGKVENFVEDIKKIHKAVNRPSLAILTNINEISGQLSNVSYKMYYTKSNISLVQSQFAKEIEMFEYEF